ncbi:hypothetical protein Agabi119p4_8536 [Agaricus bisporus var. burnettii]|uniref:Uncharacterized protein n=1 Tax=Agaricus bisporus var. burnettii TaxID=192524 RepID=A0A8H7C7C4_AGABI|nr:hypothetical protein Agabi119p4_8536 [Agaricus bisporus var. burnettii]
MSSQEDRKPQRSETGDHKPKLNVSAGSEWTFPPPSVILSHFPGGCFIALFGSLYSPPGLAPPPRSNHETYHSAPPSFPSLAPAIHSFDGSFTHGHSFNRYPDAPTSYPSHASTSHPNASTFYPATSPLPLLPPAASDDESSTLPPVENILNQVHQQNVQILYELF